MPYLHFSTTFPHQSTFLPYIKSTAYPTTFDLPKCFLAKTRKIPKCFGAKSGKTPKCFEAKTRKTPNCFKTKNRKIPKCFGARDKQKGVLEGVMRGLKAAYTNIRRWPSRLWKELLELASKHRQTHINSG